MTPEEHFQYIEGQLTGLTSAVRLLMAIAPQREAMREELAERFNAEIAAAVELNANQRYTEGMQAAGKWLTSF